jgi:hypothetical protein
VHPRPVSATATKAVSPVWEAASYRRAVNQLLTSVVRETCTLRSVGAGTGDRPGHPVEQETELSQTGLRRRRESFVSSHRETKVTAPVLDSTREVFDC